MPKHVVVTGAAGFIGRNMVAELNRRGVTDIILVDQLGTDEKWKNLVGLRYEDIVSPEAFLSMTSSNHGPSISAIIHMGACSATTERNADYLLENNYRYTRRLCEWSLHHKTRFVYASSAATYGDGENGYNDSDESTPSLKPLNMYGYSKHMFDLWALKHGHFKDIVGLKFFNVYGPYEDHKGDMKSVVYKSFYQILDRGHVELFKSTRPEYKHGEQMRDFVYVRDAVNVALSFVYDLPTVGGLFNCGTGQARTWVDLVSAVFIAMGRKPDIRFIDMPEHLKNKYQYFTQADMGKLRAAGYTAPFTSVEEGVKDYVTGYLMKK